MTKKCDDSFLKNLGGTSQASRALEALDPGSFDLHALQEEDWMRLARHFAEYVNYFKKDDALNASGNWQSFFPAGDINVIKDFLAKAETNSNLTPHLALFVCFLRLLSLSQNRMNTLTQKHLDFYYQKVLQLPKKEAVPDQVHLIFELAKNLLDTKVETQAEADGGKDITGKKRIYQTQEELILNKIHVAQIKSIYHHKDEVNGKIKVAKMTNSFDGNGEDFKNDSSWWPFGYLDTWKNRPHLDDAMMGFSLSSGILKMKEGTREVGIIFNCNNIGTVPPQHLLDHLKVYVTGEKNWIGPLTMKESTTSGYVTELTANELKLAFEVSADDDAVIPFNSDIHEGKYATTQPVVRILLDTSDAVAYSISQRLALLNIQQTTIQVTVDGISDLKLENDVGDINPKKPFYPFSTRPFKRSSFKINYDEAFTKKWTEIRVNMKWLNTPDEFRELYKAYKKTDSGFIQTKQDYIDELYVKNTPTDKTAPALSASKTVSKIIGSEVKENFAVNYSYLTSNVIVKNDAHFTAKVSIENNENPNAEINAFTLFNKTSDGHQATLILDNDFGYTPNEHGPIEMSLNQSFYHEMFPKIYTLALSRDEDDVLIPNEPYTPFMEPITMRYSASSSQTQGEVKDDEKDRILIFQEHPFGQKQATNRPFPDYPNGGELYIGLENALPNQQVSLLLQLLEGTENTEVDSFAFNERINWHVLAKEDWVSLNESHILGNTTDNFLKSGIIKISLPAESSSENTLLPSGYIWLRASMDKDFDAVCRFLDIRAQAVLAQFDNRENDLSHLKNGLEAETISKLLIRRPDIKKITQPFSSFGGRPEESQNEYYKRVSERLRHKDRAITIWDYEHIVLQEFPELHKVKCLNHTCCCSFLSPGNVTLVVVPDITQQNVFDVFEPRVSQAKLNAIQAYLNDRNTFFVLPNVTNPEYEPVKVHLGVKFNKGFDDNFYAKQLQEDIKKFFSPWAYEETAGILFDVSIHKSEFINYLEDLEYIDYLDNVRLEHLGAMKNAVIPSSPKAILVAAKYHEVSLLVNPCETDLSTQITTSC